VTNTHELEFEAPLEEEVDTIDVPSGKRYGASSSALTAVDGCLTCQFMA